jgi:ketosteroid isomerase-like protein
MCKSLVAFAVAAMLAFPVEGASTAVSGASPATEEQRVLAVEDEWIGAEINRDEITLRRVIDDRFVLNSNSGKTSDKLTLIKNILGWNLVAQTITERSVLVEGDTAVVFGTTELRFASAGKEDTTSLLRYTATYIKREGQWRAVALQMAKREPQ